VARRWQQEPATSSIAIALDPARADTARCNSPKSSAHAIRPAQGTLAPTGVR
jgi:hypothetical protein